MKKIILAMALGVVMSACSVTPSEEQYKFEQLSAEYMALPNVESDPAYIALTEEMEQLTQAKNNGDMSATAYFVQWSRKNDEQSVLRDKLNEPRNRLQFEITKVWDVCQTQPNCNPDVSYEINELLEREKFARLMMGAIN